jgi:ubiquinone biosynthesis protein Coq4
MDGGTVIFPNINNHHNIIHVVFMADKVIVGQVSLQAHWSSPANIIPPIIHTLLSSGASTIGCHV